MNERNRKRISRGRLRRVRDAPSRAAGWHVLIMAGLAGLAAAGTVRADLLVTDGLLLQSASDGIVPAYHVLSPVGLSQGTHTATSGSSLAAATYDLSADVFRFEFQHQLHPAAAGAAKLSATGSTGTIRFTTDEAVSYALSGSFGMLGAATIQLKVTLDVPGNPPLFTNMQESRDTPDQSFAVGGLAGDWSNDLAGSLTGILLPGYTYRLGYGCGLMGLESTAAGTGFLEMRVSPLEPPPPPVIPAPAALTLGILGLGLLSCARGLRNRAARGGH